MIALLIVLALRQTGTPIPENPADIQAVVRTTSGQFVLEFYAEEAPSHVANFIELAREGFYTGTTFHSMVANGIVQGGDPLSRDRTPEAPYGTGGFHMDLEPATGAIEFAAGTVATTLLPGDPDSGGSQFFICISDQPQFAGQFTSFGRVVEGLDVLERISQTPTDPDRLALERVEILEIGFRAPPPLRVVPYSMETVDELAALSVVADTSMGEIVLGFFPDVAPGHVRHFLRLVSLGVYDQTAVHRVAPGFVIQAGDLNTRTEPYPAPAREYVVPIEAEINSRRHTRGIVSLARGDALSSGLTSFFIVLEDQPSLDGVYTVFGEVVRGMDTVDRIGSVPTEGERPLERIEIYRMRVEQGN